MARYDESWLRRELTNAVNFDDFVIEGVVEAVVSANSRDDVKDIIQGFLGNDPKATQIIYKFLDARQQSQPTGRQGLQPAYGQRHPQQYNQQPVAPLQQHAAPNLGDGWVMYRKDDDQDQPQYATSTSKVKSKGRQSKPSSSQDLTALAQEPPPPTKEPEPPVDTNVGKALGMFKKGGRIRTSKGTAPTGRDPLVATASQLERKVVNCLGCGKIFDCRTVDSEISRFLASGGICTFCGDPVPLSYNTPDLRPPSPTDALDPAAPTGASASSASTSQPIDAATLAALEFKDRLVGYDRDAAKRTTVIDDQSDFFEIDSNAWLTDEERQEMRERRRLEEAAEAARKQRVTVTLDLLGRRVLVDGDGQAPSAGFELGGAASSRGGGGGGEGTSSGAAGTSGRGAQESGAALKEEMATVSAAQLRAQLAREAAALKELRITANPNIPTPPPVFLPSALPKPGASTASSKQHHGPAGKGGARGKEQKAPQAAGARLAGIRRPEAVSRVQDDNVFDTFEEDLLSEEMAQMALDGVGKH